MSTTISRECCLGASVIGMAFPFLFTTPGNGGGEVLETHLGCARNSKELIVEWEQPRLQLTARSLVILNPHVKGNWVSLGRGESLIF